MSPFATVADSAQRVSANGDGICHLDEVDERGLDGGEASSQYVRTTPATTLNELLFTLTFS